MRVARKLAVCIVVACGGAAACSASSDTDRGGFGAGAFGGTMGATGGAAATAGTGTGGTGATGGVGGGAGGTGGAAATGGTSGSGGTGGSSGTGGTGATSGSGGTGATGGTGGSSGTGGGGGSGGTGGSAGSGGTGGISGTGGTGGGSGGCSSGFKSCNGQCEAPGVTNGCGPTGCTACPVIANAMRSCSNDQCAYQCNTGFIDTGGACVAPSCMDSMQNGGETDVDCGGGACAPCPTGSGCMVNTDCEVGTCESMICECTPMVCGDIPGACGAAMSDGCNGTIDCSAGSCVAPDTCGGGTTPDVCGCTPQTCGQLTVCGMGLDDACGSTIDCPCDPAVCPGDPLTMTGSPPSATASGSTNGAGDDTDGSCSNGRDNVYQIVAPQDGTLTITVMPSGFSAAVYVRSGSCTGGSELGCENGGLLGSGDTITLTVNVMAGETYWIFVDQNSGLLNGSFTMTASY